MTEEELYLLISMLEEENAQLRHKLTIAEERAEELQEDLTDLNLAINERDEDIKYIYDRYVKEKYGLGSRW